MILGLRNLPVLLMILLGAGLAEAASEPPLYQLDFERDPLKNTGTLGGEASPAAGTQDIRIAKDKRLGLAAAAFAMQNNGQKGEALVLPQGMEHLMLENPDDALTVVLWVKWNGPSGHPTDKRHGIVSKSPSTKDRGWAFSILDDGRLQFNWVTEKSGNFRHSAESVPQGEWTALAMIWSNAASDGGLRFYINGQSAGINQGWTGGGPLVASNEEIFVGVMDDQSFLPLNGAVAAIRIFDRALTESEIEALAVPPTFSQLGK